MSDSLRRDFLSAAKNDEVSTGAAALRLARLEYAHLDPAPYLALLDEMAAEVARRFARIDRGHGTIARLAVLNDYLYGQLGFTGDREHYEDPRNSFLNVVLDRRSGIPITLAVVFLEIAGRVGLRAEGVNFPGHFLVRLPGDRAGDEPVLIDPFHAGAIVSQEDCYELLRTYLGSEAALDTSMLAAAGKPQILLRMLLNLKRSYVKMRSFPQARTVTDLLLGLDGASLTELRDRGLLAYHMQDFSSALGDLQEYLRLAPVPDDEEGQQEHAQVWDHVKALRRRIAGLN